VKPPPFDYHAPSTTAEALDLLAKLEDAKVLAGGQSLIPLLNFRLASPAHLVDINGIAELEYVRERDGGVAIGAGARQSDVEDDKTVRRICPLLAEALGQVAHPVIRNRGTVCGSLAHADPAAELPAVLLAAGGEVVARSVHGERRITAQDFFKGVFDSALEADELLVEAWFPATTGPFALVEESRRHGDFALAGAARSGDRLALFGVAPTPVLADPTDPSHGLSPSGDLEATPAFRLHLVEVLVRRAFAS